MRVRNVQRTICKRCVSYNDHENAQQSWNTVEKKKPWLVSQYLFKNKCFTIGRYI